MTTTALPAVTRRAAARVVDAVGLRDRSTTGRAGSPTAGRWRPPTPAGRRGRAAVAWAFAGTPDVVE
ncbi:hypothetical protein [Streptomyces sp. NPDC059071]|uniref:hypothetical protein n=1 Tax=unclassified Streptomyces TaxID=2593676 RepID=UPI00365CDC28